MRWKIAVGMVIVFGRLPREGLSCRQAYPWVASSMRVLVTHYRAAALDRFVKSVTDPASPDYRHYLTIGQLANRFGTSGKAQRQVTAWLTAHGLHARIDPTHTYYQLSLSAVNTA